MTTKVSVLMAVYNGESFLRAALDSILAQTFRDFEFIVVDDGSTDGTQAILESVDDPRILRRTNSENVGLTRSLNIGLRLARGEYVTRMDADDVAHPERLALQTAFLDRHTDHVLVSGSYRLIDSDGQVIDTNIKPMGDTELRWVSHLRTALEHAAVTFRRLSPQGEPYLYDERYPSAQDAEFWPRLMDDGKGAVLSDLVLDYRSHPENVTMKHSDWQMANMQAILLERATGRYALSASERKDVEDLLSVYLRGAPYSDEKFSNAVRGMRLLTSAFILRKGLGPEEARFVRARAAGQLWFASMKKGSPRPMPLHLLRLLWLGRASLPDLARRLAFRRAGARGQPAFGPP